MGPLGRGSANLVGGGMLGPGMGYGGPIRGGSASGGRSISGTLNLAQPHDAHGAALGAMLPARQTHRPPEHVPRHSPCGI